MSLLKLRNRHKSIKGLNSVLTALQMVTVVRLQRVKARCEVNRGYLKPLRPILKGRLEPLQLGKKVMVIVTSNRGLCGGFNKQVVAQAIKFAADDPNFRFVMLGKKGVELLRGKPQYAGRTIFSNYASVEKADWQASAKVVGQILDLKAQIYVAYNTYKSVVVQVPQVKQLYPLPAELKGQPVETDYILEPDKKTLLEQLSRHYIEALFYQLLLDSQYGELAARLMELKGAVKNSKDLIESLALSVNKARQATITRELIELVSSAEAMRRDYE